MNNAEGVAQLGINTELRAFACCVVAQDALLGAFRAYDALCSVGCRVGEAEIYGERPTAL